jgi:hypothetical protein
MPYLGGPREAAQALTARAMLRLKRGEIDAARADLIAVYRLGRLVSHGQTLVERLVGIGLESLAASATAAAAGSGKLTPDQARTMLADIAALPAGGNVIDAIDRGERFIMLDAIMMMYRGVSIKALDAMQEGPRGLRRGRRPNLDWNEMLRLTNQCYDRSVAAMRKPTAAARQVASAEFTASIVALVRGRLARTVKMCFLKLGGWPCRKAYSRRMFEVLLCLMMPSLERAAELQIQAHTRTDQARLALALAAWKAEKGAWPEKLAALTPAHLEEIPLDRFSGEPLIYKPGEKGFLLFSCGPNGGDDGGGDGGSGADDIRIEVSTEAKRRRWRTTTRPALSQPAPDFPWPPQGLP